MSFPLPRICPEDKKRNRTSSPQEAEGSWECGRREGKTCSPLLHYLVPDRSQRTFWILSLKPPPLPRTRNRPDDPSHAQTSPYLRAHLDTTTFSVAFISRSQSPSSILTKISIVPLRWLCLNVFEAFSLLLLLSRESRSFTKPSTFFEPWVILGGLFQRARPSPNPYGGAAPS